MNKEKELLLKLLMEKYEDGELDDDCGESNSGWGYGSYGGAKYRVVEPEQEVWEGVFAQYLNGELTCLKGIIAYVLNAVGETYLTGVERKSPNDWRLSFLGGDPHKIGEALFLSRSLGVAFHGDTTVEGTLSSGREWRSSFNYEYA